MPSQHKIVVITGGGSGIGLAFSKLAVASNFRVLIADLKLSSDAAEWMERLHCEQTQSPRVAFQYCDVTNWQHLRQLPQKSIELWEKVPDIWIPGAGVFEPTWSSFWNDHETEQYASININLSHSIQFNRIAVRSLIASKKPGVVLNIASDAGLYAFPGCPLYTATKHAIVGFTRSLAPLESYANIKVVAICPVGVSTPMFTKEKMEQFGCSDEEMLTPETVARAMLEMTESSRYSGGSVALLCRTDGTNLELTAHPKPHYLPDSAIDEFDQFVQQILDSEKNLKTV